MRGRRPPLFALAAHDKWREGRQVGENSKMNALHARTLLIAQLEAGVDPLLLQHALGRGLDLLRDAFHEAEADKGSPG